MNEHRETAEKELTHEQKETIKLRLSRFIEDKLRASTEKYIVAKLAGGDKDLVEFLLEEWPENDGVPAIRRPIFQVEGYSVRFESETTEYDSAHKRFSFALSGLREAETEESIREALENLIDSVYHEVEHTGTEGAELEGETIEDMVRYLCNPGEIEAYGRQFARRYMSEYSGQDFDMANMEELAAKSKSKTGGARNLYHYIHVFAQPEKVQEFSQFGDVRAAREAVIAATIKHMQSMGK